ncbi:hypothetical protein ACLB2K_037806 [Fragaria x ananassa]
MLPEWMIDVPHRLPHDWFVLARPAGERCLVVSYDGCTVSRRRNVATVSRRRNGAILHRFPSALPDGSRCRTKAQPSCSILDCIFNEMDQTYYVIDMVCWRGYSLYDCTAEFRFFWLKSKLAETRACDPPSYYHRYRFSLVPWYTCDLTGLHTAYNGPVPYVKDGLMFYNKYAHYQPRLTPLALVWKDHNCSNYVVDTDNEGKVPCHQQMVLKLQRDGKVTTSDDPPVVFGCLGLDLIQKLGTLQSGCLLRFAIGDGGLTIVDGKLEKADIHYLGKSNRARAFADCYSKIMFQNGVPDVASYVLGAVFLQLCKALRLDEHPVVQKLVDPSWFIHRFTESLPGGRDKGVMQTAHRIITSMKRDWMQTGRKPSGICGAALYISALSHGLKCSKSDIIKIVHVCDATLTKRLVEFENTESGSLTIEEFLLKAKELDEISKQPIMADKMDDTVSSPSEQRILCEHMDSGKPYAHGLCQICYDDFMTISGGIDGGANPPAFQRAEIERLKKPSAELNANDSGIDTIASKSLDNSNQLSEFEKENNTKSGSKNKGLLPMEPVSDGAAMENTAVDIGIEDCDDESDNFSDIDDLEVDGYLLNEEGQRYKKMIWEEMNREYIEEQAAKEEAAKAAMDINCPEGAKKLAQITEAAVAKRKKERQLARAAEAKNSTPAQTAD